MEKDLFLSVKNCLGNIHKCKHDVVHINIHGFTIRFKQDSFFLFASMVDEAYSKLINRSLADLINKEQKEKEEK